MSDAVEVEARWEVVERRATTASYAGVTMLATGPVLAGAGLRRARALCGLAQLGVNERGQRW